MRAARRGEPILSVAKWERRAVDMEGQTHLDALGVLESLLEHGNDNVGLEVHHEVDAPAEDSVCGLAREDVAALDHTERLGLECVPRAAARHSLVGEVCDGVDCLSADYGYGFMEEGM